MATNRVDKKTLDYMKDRLPGLLEDCDHNQENLRRLRRVFEDNCIVDKDASYLLGALLFVDAVIELRRAGSLDFKMAW